MRSNRWWCLLCLGLLAVNAHAAMVTRPVSWQLDGKRYDSVLVYDDAVTARRPGLLMVPNWYGVNATAIEKAKRIAGKDYVILLTDLYGEGLRPTTEDQAQAAVKPLYGNRPELRKRVVEAYAQLKAQIGKAPIDPARLAAIGFCFGGSAVLDLARSGAAVAAVVSFHGGLATDDPALAGQIKASVLAINGADDVGTMPDAPAFLSEMKRSPAPWQFDVIGHAVHCFTETEATASSGNCRYDARAAAQSYGLMRLWLQQAFAASAPAS